MPPEPGFFGQLGQSIGGGLHSGAINRAGELGVMGGAFAADMAANRLRQFGGAVRDGALDYRDFYLGELPEMVREAFGRRPAPPPQDFA